MGKMGEHMGKKEGTGEAMPLPRPLSVCPPTRSVWCFARCGGVGGQSLSGRRPFGPPVGGHSVGRCRGFCGQSVGQSGVGVGEG